MVTEICKDIRQLDAAKKNLTVCAICTCTIRLLQFAGLQETIGIFAHLKTLSKAIADLKAFAKNRGYRVSPLYLQCTPTTRLADFQEAAPLLEAAVQVSFAYPCL